MQTQIDLWRSAPPPTSELAVCVVVPVRNEAAGLQRTLSALAAQTVSPSRPFDRQRYEVLLLANNCQDSSAAIARDFALRHPDLALHVAEVELPAHLANIGHVRKLLMDAAAARLSGASANSVIASTDGDTEVAPDWLMCILREIDAGADAVGGRILIAPDDDTDAELRRWRRLDASYRLACERLASLLDPDPADPWPRHHQHFCGSLAVTRAVYLQVGGLPEVSYLEDEALVSALRRHDLSVRHSPAVRVVTSGRQAGRAEVGLAWQLRQWAEARGDARGLMVEDAPVLAERFTARRRLRAMWQGRPKLAAVDEAGADPLARRWHITGEALAECVAAAPTFGALWAELESTLHGADVPARLPTLMPAPVPIRTAIAGLRVLATRLGAHQSERWPLRSNRSSR